jgi:hypothetical protein
MERKFGEKIQAVLVKLDLAKQEDSQKITEEKIRVIKSDFSKWAEDFVTNLPAEKDKFSQLKTAQQNRQTQDANRETQKQKQRSGQSYPVFSFAIRFLQESVRAFALKTANTNIVIDSIDLPENLFEKPTQGFIRFKANVLWELAISSGWTSTIQHRADYDVGQPYLRFTFYDNRSQQSGEFHIQINQEGNKMTFFYMTNLPTPNPESIQGEYDLSDYESAIKDALQRIIKSQLLQLED